MGTHVTPEKPTMNSADVRAVIAGQVRPVVDVYNMRYAESVEDRVHELLSGRLQNISRLFGQLLVADDQRNSMPD